MKGFFPSHRCLGHGRRSSLGGFVRYRSVETSAWQRNFNISTYLILIEAMNDGDATLKDAFALT